MHRPTRSASWRPAVYNEDRALNTCGNRAAAGSRVSVVLTGTGLIAPAVAVGYHPVEAVAPVPGQPLGVWQVFLRLDQNARGYSYSSLRVDGVPAREQGVAIWVAPEWGRFHPAVRSASRQADCQSIESCFVHPARPNVL